MAAGMKGKLTITLHKGRDLKDTNLIAKSDPYVQVWTDGEKFKTKVHQNGGKNPVWEQSFIFNLEGKEDLLHMHCYDKETFSDDSIGRADIPLKQLHFNKSEWYNIVDKDNFSKVTGAILMTVTFAGTGAPEPPKAEAPKVAEAPKTVSTAAAAAAPVYQAPQSAVPIYQAPAAAAPAAAAPVYSYGGAAPVAAAPAGYGAAPAGYPAAGGQVVYQQAPVYQQQQQVVYQQAPAGYVAPQVVYTAPTVVYSAPVPTNLNGKYYITSYHNKRLSCSDQSVLYASDNFAGWETWTLTEVGGGKYLITSAHGTQLSCSDQNVLYMSQNKAGWEQWTVTSGAGGKTFLTSYHGNNLGMTDGNGQHKLYCNNKNTGGWEQWELRRA